MLRKSFSYLLLPLLINLAVFVPESKASMSDDEAARILGGFPITNPSAAAQLIQERARAAGVSSFAGLVANGDSSEPALVNLNTQNGRRVIQNFFAQNLGPARTETRSLLYFFGGADVIYPPILFPNLQRMILVGREAPGSLLDPYILAQQGTLISKIAEIRRAFRDVYRESYFITANMATELSNFGTTTMIAVGLLAGDAQIRSVQLVSLDRDGSLIIGHSGRIRGSRIEYLKPNGQIAEVIYFQKDLANGFMRSEPEFLAYLNRQDFDTAYFKAASHLPHNQGSFSDVTSFVLGKVRFLVQADNGIPFRVLRAQASSWRLRLFGLYAPPSRGFTAGASQSDLSQAYASKLCGRAGARAEQVWAAVWGRCQGNSDNFGFHELTWEGLVPSHYDYSAFSGPGTRNNIAISTPVQRNEMTIFSNLMIAEKVR